MVSYIHIPKGERTDPYHDPLFRLFLETEGEFVPPLHDRNGTTQKDLARTGLSEEERRANLSAYFNAMMRQELIVALDGDRLVGFLSYWPDRIMSIGPWTVTAHYVSTIAVRKDCRRKGIGTGLYRALFRECGENAAYATRTWRTNDSHRRILERLGFVLALETDEGRKDGNGFPVSSLYYAKGLGDTFTCCQKEKTI